MSGISECPVRYMESLAGVGSQVLHRLLDSLRIPGIRCGSYRFKYQGFFCYQVCCEFNCLQRCWIRLMNAGAIILLKREVDDNTGTSDQITNTRLWLDIQWFCKRAGFDL